jgi:uncharacterized protein YcbK (DUF882 family)
MRGFAVLLARGLWQDDAPSAHGGSRRRAAPTRKQNREVEEMPVRPIEQARPERRRVLALVLATIAGLVFEAPRQAAAQGVLRRLSFDNIHTGEKLTAAYWQDGHYLPDGLREIDYSLRDFRTGDIYAIDPRLLDLLYRLRQQLAYDGPIHVISGYRCPATNAMLAARSPRVSKTSFHMRGMAIDIRIPGRPLPELRDAAMLLGMGGVGYYPESDFVHVDTGPVRFW